MAETEKPSVPPGNSVAIIGAGPAGLFAARELAHHGVRVTLFNRDIKPGGLAEYGIYPDKIKMKEGLRAQFRATLALPVDRHNSIKLYASSGVTMRTGTDFDIYGVAWQHRWGGGL